MHKRRIALVLPLVGLLSFALAACGNATSSVDPRTQIPLVRVVTVATSVPAERSFTGIVEARVQSDLGFRVPGKILERLVDAGQMVERGEPLMRIDPTDLRLAARAREDGVAAAMARARQAAEDEVRYRDLVAAGAVSASAYDQAKAAADAARAQLSAAEAEAEVALNATRYAELLADADGGVMETLAEPGQVVNAGQIVVRVARAGPREAVVQLPETLRPVIGSAGQATLFGNGGVSVATRLRQLSDAADRLTRTFEARYVLEGELANAPLGTTVTIRIPAQNQTVEDALQVPIGALFDAGKGPGVWVIKGEPATVSWQPVAVQRLDQDNAHIAGHIKQGDRIVALGVHLLREGEQVRVASHAAALATAGARP